MKWCFNVEGTCHFLSLLITLLVKVGLGKDLFFFFFFSHCPRDTKEGIFVDASICLLCLNHSLIDIPCR